MSEVDAQTRCEIIDVYTAYGEGIDTKNWPLVRSCFADEIYIDYGETGAATGGAGNMRSAEAWMAALQSVINGFDITRHTISNFRFRDTEEGVECRAYLTSDHVIFGDSHNNGNLDRHGRFLNSNRRFDVRIGLISLIPNLLPAAMGFGLWGYLVGNVTLAIAVVLAATLGIVVDDTVHFLSKYAKARREGKSAEDAVRYAFKTVGMALTVGLAIY